MSPFNSPNQLRYLFRKWILAALLFLASTPAFSQFNDCGPGICPKGLFSRGGIGGGGGGGTPAPAGLAMSFLPAGAITTPNVSAGSHAALQWERTQAWTMIAQIQIPGPPTVVAGGGGTAAIIFTTCNQGAGGSVFTGYEGWVDGNGKLRLRLINNIGATQYLGVIGSTTLTDNVLRTVAISYDGSGVVGGVKMYVNGILETLTTESNTLGANTIVNALSFLIGNQTGFPYPLGGSLSNFFLEKGVMSQAQIAAFTTAAGAVDANTALAYNFSEGSGSTTADLSPNGFTGTVNSAQWPPTGSLNEALTDNGQSGTAGTTFTYGRNFVVRPGGLVIAAASARIGANTTAVLSSLSVGGSGATSITGSDSRNTSGGALSTTSFWQIPVASGTSKALSALYSASMARSGIELFSVVGASGSTPSGGAVGNMTGTSAGAVGTCSVTVPTGGVALIAGTISSVTGNPTVTPTNFTLHGGPVNLASTMWYASGFDTTVGTNTYTMTWGGTSPSIPTMSCVAWGP